MVFFIETCNHRSLSIFKEMSICEIARVSVDKQKDNDSAIECAVQPEPGELVFLGKVIKREPTTIQDLYDCGLSKSLILPVIREKRDARLMEMDKLVMRHTTQTLSGIETTLPQDVFSELLSYIQNLRDFPKIFMGSEAVIDLPPIPPSLYGFKQPAAGIVLKFTSLLNDGSEVSRTSYFVTEGRTESEPEINITIGQVPTRETDLTVFIRQVQAMGINKSYRLLDIDTQSTIQLQDSIWTDIGSVNNVEGEEIESPINKVFKVIAD